MKKVLLIVMLISVAKISTFSQSLYSNTTYSSRFNPGLGSQGTPIVAYDDVYIPSILATGSDSISITKINIGIRRAPNAPSTNVNLYYTTFKQDTTDNKTIAEASVFLGKVNLPVNGSSLVTSVLSFGDSTSALFKIKTDANIAKNSYQILIGASLDNPSPGNGVILGRASENNEDLIWIENADNNKEVYATSLSGHLPASYYLEVFGKGSNQPAKEDKNIIGEVAVNKNTGLQISK